MVQRELTVIAEHSVCLELLPEKANILDAGCRGFEFTNYFREKGHNVLAIDIDYLLAVDLGSYLRRGIGPISGIGKVSLEKDKQATRITSFIKGNPREMKDYEVIIHSLVDLQKIAHVKTFDLIKLDVEGDEFKILQSAKHPIAKQVSVEFHAHCTDQTKESLDNLLTHLSQWYEVHNQVWESRHGAGFNYWDVLLIAK